MSVVTDTPTYAFITNTQFVNNNGSIWRSIYLTILVFDHCEILNNTTDWLISAGSVYQESVAPDALPPALNFTNHIVGGNSFQLRLSIFGNEGLSLIDHNKITNDLVAIKNGSSYNIGTCLVEIWKMQIPMVLSNNLFACNRASDGTFHAFFSYGATAASGSFDASFSHDTKDPLPWILANNVNGDPINCPIQPLAGSEMADSINTQPCGPGYYNNLDTGSTHCIPCAPGSYSAPRSSVVGATTCSLCDAGSYSSEKATSVCSQCNSGNYSSQAGATSCEACPIDTCTPPFGYQTTCQLDPCPPATRRTETISLD